MKRTEKRRFGDLGEDIVCKWLENKVFSVIGRNYWKPWGEIDIVAQKGSVLHFVEVKSVSHEMGTNVSREILRPEENMHPSKIERLHRTIHSYLLEHHIPEMQDWQLDLACVYIDVSTRRARVEMLENIIV